MYNMKYLYKIINFPGKSCSFTFMKRRPNFLRPNFSTAVELKTLGLCVYFGTYCGKHGLSDNFLSCVFLEFRQNSGVNSLYF